MKIAIVHDHFFEFGGAERVAVALMKIYPDADVYTAGYSKKIIETHLPAHMLGAGSTGNKIHRSWASYIPFFHKLYSPLRFLTPWIWESFNFSGYDLVISSSGWFMSKGVITKAPTLHVSYVHHQPKYLYFYKTAVEWQKYFLIRIYAGFINHFLRMWDYTSSQRPNYLVVNSIETQKRVKKLYRRDSVVIYPPVEARLTPGVRHDDYYVVLSRLARTKNIDLIIRTCVAHNKKLKIIGTGRDEEYLKSLAHQNSTIEFLGFLSDQKSAEIIAQAKAFIFCAEEEEFGIAPVEALQHGTPVIAYADGGLKETIQNGKNGYLFTELSEESLWKAIQKLEGLSQKDYATLSKNAKESGMKYAYEVFHKQITRFINSKLHAK